MLDPQPCKVAFKSGGQFLTERPRWRQPIGVWNKHLSEALLFDAEVFQDGKLRWPWHLACCGDYSDGGAELHERFRRYMFPGGRPEIVVVDLVERSGS